MDIVIHGTNGGYRLLYATPGSSPAIIQRDVRSSNSTSEKEVGQSAYSIAYAADGCVLTKYVIVRDAIRSKATGYIAFSVYFPNNEKLMGKDIHDLLDDLSDMFCTRHAPGYNLDSFHDDWIFVGKAESQYKIKKGDFGEVCQPGTGDAAYIYYANETDLQKFLNDPYQDKYKTYKQIFFVERQLKGDLKNPLIAFQHHPDNDLTNQMDVDNLKRYKIITNAQTWDNRLKVEIRANSSGGRVTRKEKLYISYEQKYRESGKAEGTWEEIKRQKPSWIAVDDDREMITINPIQLSPEIRTVKIEVSGEKSQSRIYNLKVICTDRHGGNLKDISGKRSIDFVGDTIGEEWIIKASATGHEEKEETFKPETKSSVNIRLSEQKKFKVEVRDRENNQLFSSDDYSLNVYCRTDRLKYPVKEKDNTIVFTGDEIEKEWRIEALKNGYWMPEGKVFCPKNEQEHKPVPIYMDKKVIRQPSPSSHNSQNTYEITFKANKKYGKLKKGEYGGFTEYDGESFFHITNLPDHHTQVIQIFQHSASIKPVPKPFYKFDGWQKKKTDNNQYEYKAHFKLRKWDLIALCSLLVILATTGVVFWLRGGEQAQAPKEKEGFSIDCISDYVQSDSLLPVRLNEFKKYLENQQKSPEKEKSLKSASREFRDKIFPKSNEDNGKQPNNPQNDRGLLIAKLDSAMVIRNFIREAEIDSLKAETILYHEKQKTFKEAVSKENAKAVIDSLKANIDQLTLSEIAEAINPPQDDVDNEETQSENESETTEDHE